MLDQARAQGLVPPEVHPSEEEALEFLFHPGFSTSDEVTELAGRGVGLDVVRRNIEALRGTVSVESQPGRGTTFRIKLPLTLAIIDGMNIRVSDQVFTLPLLAIVETLQPKAADVKTVEGKGELLQRKGQYITLVRLGQLFGLSDQDADLTDSLVLVLESMGRRFGLVVDEVLGEQPAVIKSIERHFQPVTGVSGATILPDGRVGLILDVQGLERLAFEH